MSTAFIQGPVGVFSDSAAASSKTVTNASGGRFKSATNAGALLVCACFCEVNTPGSPIPTINTPVTPGIAWVLASTEGNSGFDGAAPISTRISVYYAAHAPSIGPAVVTSLTATTPATANSLTLGFEMYEFIGNEGAVGVTAAATGTSPSTPGTANLSLSDTSLVFVAACCGNNYPFWAGAGYAVGSSGTYTASGQYILNAPAGSTSTLFSTTGNSNQYVWACVAIAFGTGGLTGGGGGTGSSVGPCAAVCAGPPLLNTIPGFSDLPDSVLATDDPTFALHVGEISFNAAFGMVRCEIFPCIPKHGDIIPLPVSCADGYTYAREELLYMWTIRNSTDPSTNWIGAVDSLWFTNWNVDQATGEVFSEEWYERSSTADSRQEAKTNDGSILVFTIGQRQKTNMIMRAAASYTAISESDIATDKPLKQALIQALNDDAKFSVVNSEVFYLGEYVDGDTVTLPVSPVDGYTYSFAECKLMHSWRWTASGAQYIQPPWGVPGSNCDQLGPFTASIDGSGVVTIVVSYISAGGERTEVVAGFGRIAAFAFCTRNATPGSMARANNFTELDVGFFFPGENLRASTVLAIKRNIDEAILTPEFFGPTEYNDADTVPLPVSAVDGYTYTRNECHYIWSWSSTDNDWDWPDSGSHARIPLFLGMIDQATGTVTLNVWRLPPGGPYVDDQNQFASIRVIVMANRQASHPEIIDNTVVGTPVSAGTYSSDSVAMMVGDSGSGGSPGAVPAPAAGDWAAFKFFGADGNYSVPGGAGATPFDMGFFYPGSPPFASQLIFRAIPTRACTFAAGLSLSSATAVTAATGSTVFSLQKNGSQFGTVTFAAAGTSGTFAAASSTSFNGTTDALSVVGPATPDATLANIGVVIAGTR